MHIFDRTRIYRVFQNLKSNYIEFIDMIKISKLILIIKLSQSIMIKNKSKLDKEDMRGGRIMRCELDKVIPGDYRF